MMNFNLLFARRADSSSDSPPNTIKLMPTTMSGCAFGIAVYVRYTSGECSRYSPKLFALTYSDAGQVLSVIIICIRHSARSFAASTYLNAPKAGRSSKSSSGSKSA